MHYSESLFNIFTSIEALRWTLFARNIDARGWELHLRDSLSRDNQTKYLAHGGSCIEVGKAEEMEIARAMVERTQVELEA